MMRRIEHWLWIHATCRQGWRRIPLPWFLLNLWGKRREPCGHPLNELDDYGCGVCCMQAIRRRNGPRIRARLAQRRKESA